MPRPDGGAPFYYLSDQRAAVSRACEGAIKRGVYEQALALGTYYHSRTGAWLMVSFR